YDYETYRGLWVVPICFSVRPAESHVVALGLLFDEQDRLVDWDVQEGLGYARWIDASWYKVPRAFPEYKFKPTIKDHLFPELSKSATQDPRGALPSTLPSTNPAQR